MSDATLKQFARVFIAKSDERTIVATIHQNELGVWYEDESPTVLEPASSAEQVGRAVREAMRKTSVRPKDLRSHKLTDWPCFKASRLRSVRQFEDRYIAIRVRGANEANIIAVVTGSPEKDAPLDVTTTASMSDEPLGVAIIQVFEACRDRRI